MDFATKAIHTKLPSHQWDGSRCVAPPITLSATYLMTTPEEVSGEWLYGRYGNPSRDHLEATLAALEGDAKHALCFSSGMAAANAMLEATLGHNSHSGDHVVAIRQVIEPKIRPTFIPSLIPISFEMLSHTKFSF